MAFMITARESGYDPDTMKRVYGTILNEIPFSESGEVRLWNEDGSFSDTVIARNLFDDRFQINIPANFNVSLIEHEGEYKILDAWVGRLTYEQAQPLQLQHQY